MNKLVATQNANYNAMFFSATPSPNDYVSFNAVECAGGRRTEHPIESFTKEGKNGRRKRMSGDADGSGTTPLKSATVFPLSSPSLLLVFLPRYSLLSLSLCSSR